MKNFKISVRYRDTSDNLSRYFSEVSKEELLAPHEEAELAFLAKKGDQKSKDRIIRANLRFVISVAKAYSNKNAPVEDLISEGNKGLIEALEIFDPSTGFKFISYAIWHIRKNIFSYLNSHSKIVRIPINVLADMKRYQDIEGIFIGKHGREPNTEELIELMQKNGIKTPSNNAIDVIKNKPSQVSLENTIDNDGESKSPINWLAAEDDLENQISRNDAKAIVESMLDQLMPIEKSLIILRYGLRNDKEESMTYFEIGLKHERTAEWARKVILKAEKRIKIIARKKGIKYLI
jgi:RNA polymerase primary sigma factor